MNEGIGKMEKEKMEMEKMDKMDMDKMEVDRTKKDKYRWDWMRLRILQRIANGLQDWHDVEMKTA